MNPPVVTDMLEIVGGKATSASVYERAQVLALHLNKTVCFSLDRPVRPFPESLVFAAVFPMDI